MSLDIGKNPSLPDVNYVGGHSDVGTKPANRRCCATTRTCRPCRSCSS
jgi:hypothetical protein